MDRELKKLNPMTIERVRMRNELNRRREESETEQQRHQLSNPEQEFDVRTIYMSQPDNGSNKAKDGVQA